VSQRTPDSQQRFASSSPGMNVAYGLLLPLLWREHITSSRLGTSGAWAFCTPIDTTSGASSPPGRWQSRSAPCTRPSATSTLSPPWKTRRNLLWPRACPTGCASSCKRWSSTPHVRTDVRAQWRPNDRGTGTFSPGMHVVWLDVRCVLPVGSSPDRCDERPVIEMEYANDGDASSQSRQKNPAPRS
jgi:hypothetical protein